MEAWTRFRPKPFELEDEGDPGAANESVKSKKTVISTSKYYKKPLVSYDMHEIFGETLVFNIMSNIHLKLYGFADTDEERLQRKSYKDEFSGVFNQ